jgi:ABC-2 type transport system permease protein
VTPSRTRRAWVQYRAVVTKEVRQTVRDRRMIFMLLVAPVIQLAVLGSAVDFDVDDVPAVVVDQDGSAASRAHTAALLADGTLARVGETRSVAAAETMLVDGEASAVIVFPAGFGGDLGAGRPTAVQVVLDGSDPTRSSVVAGVVGRYFGEVGVELATRQIQARAASAGVSVRRASVRFVPRILYNPAQVTSAYIVPGIAAMLLLIVTTIVTAKGLAREKEMGTLEQVLVTPLPSGVLMLGKLTPFVIVGLLDVALALVVGSWVFDVPLRGSLTFLFGATVLYLLSTLGVGLLISTISSNQQQAFMGGFLFMLPAVLLSGNMTPIASMPEWMQPITLLNPLRYYIEILRSVLLKGSGAPDLWPQALALAVFGVVLVGVASSRFRKRLA